MKIQKIHKAGLLALTMLFGMPSFLMAAGGQWEHTLNALHHNQMQVVTEMSEQERAILEATILLKSHRPEQAMHILEAQPDEPLIKQLKIQAGREHYVEVVRRAGGTRSEVHFSAQSTALRKALAEVDSRLNLFMKRLHAEETNAGGQAVQKFQIANYNNNVATSGFSGVHQISLIEMTPSERWKYVLKALQHNTSKAAQHLSKRDRAILQIAVLLKTRQPAQALKLLEAQTTDAQTRQLKIHVSRERIVEAVRKAGGDRSEVHLPQAPAGMADVIAAMDARLQVFVLQLNGKKTMPTTSLARVADKVAVADAKNHLKHANEITRAAARAPASSPVQKKSHAEKVATEQTIADTPVHADVKADNVPAFGTAPVLEKPHAQAVVAEQTIADTPVHADVKADNAPAFATAPVQEKPHAQAVVAEQTTADISVHADVKADNAPAFATAPVQEKPHAQVVVAEQTIADISVHADIKAANTPVSGTASIQVAQKAAKIAVAGSPSLSPEVHKAILQAVESWRAAWSNRNVDAYFSAYARDFDTMDRFASMDAWKTYKRWVIGKRSSIQVSLELVKVHALPDGQVRVEFLQHFRADSYQSDDLKALTLRHSSNGGWKIVREESV